MRLLLDTHAWIWAVDETAGNLAPAARTLIEDGANDVFFSAASAWEIAIKYSMGMTIRSIACWSPNRFSRIWSSSRRTRTSRRMEWT